MSLTYLIILISVESIILAALAITKKLTGKAFFVIAFAALLLSVAGFFALNKASAKDEDISSKDYIYMAGRLIEQEHFPESLSALGAVSDEGNEAFMIKPLRGLAYNENEAYQLAVVYLEGTEDDNAGKVYDISLQGERADEELRKSIVDASIEALGFSDAQMEALDEKLSRLYLDYQNQEASDEASLGEIEIVRGMISNNHYSEAFAVMANRAKRFSDDSIILAEMYVRGYDNRNLKVSDEAYDAILDELTRAQVEAALAKQDFVSDYEDEETPSQNKEYYAKQARYSVLLEDLSEESMKRAVNYLGGLEKSSFADPGKYECEMAYLYYRLHDEDSSKRYLNELFDAADRDGDSSDVYRGCEALERAYAIYVGDSSSIDFDLAYDYLMSILYKNVFENAADEGFKEYLLEYLKERNGGIQVANINVEAFPEIEAAVFTTRDDVSIDEKSIAFTDTGNDVVDLSITKEESELMSICYVLDVSGSMNGSRIIEAKDAIRESAQSLDETSEVALVSFENSAEIVATLTTKKNSMIGHLDRLDASGGTNIASGLELGVAALEGANGTRAIILLSDGQDGNKGELPAALRKAMDRGIPVYTVGLEGCDEQYLSNIADSTGGVFASVQKAGYLSEVYSEIQSYLQTKYIVKFTVKEQDTDHRYMICSVNGTPRRVQKSYSASGGQDGAEAVNYSQMPQEADLFKQTGGTLVTGGGN